ncbi:MAG: hypothetical protein ABL962_12490 [Fimbriimonadaceae bacterium]
MVELPINKKEKWRGAKLDSGGQRRGRFALGVPPLKPSGPSPIGNCPAKGYNVTELFQQSALLIARVDFAATASAVVGAALGLWFSKGFSAAAKSVSTHIETTPSAR